MEILVDNSKIRILKDMVFVIESQELKELSFCIIFRKIKWQHFQKKYKISLFGLFLSKFGQKLLSVSKSKLQKSEKANEPILRKTLN